MPDRDLEKPERSPPWLSLYKAFRLHERAPKVSLDHLAESIEKRLSGYTKKAGVHSQRIAEAETDEDRQKAEQDYTSFKRNLPAVTPSGTFSPQGRKTELLTQHSGLIVIDFDDLDDATQCKEQLAALPCVVLAFTSPSGRGVKPFVAVDPIPANADEHKAAFQAVAKALRSRGLPVQLMQEGGNRDSGQTDVTRLCYLVGDPQIFYQWPAPSPVTWERSSLPGATHPTPPPQAPRRYVMGSGSPGGH